MLTADDFLHLPYTADLNQAGIYHACRWLAHATEPSEGSVNSSLRMIIMEKTAELAFRRCLSAAELPFENAVSTPLTDPEHVDVLLGGRRCEIKTFPLSQERLTLGLRRRPDWLLQVSAQVAEDQLFATLHSDLDLFIFSFVVVAESHADTPHPDCERAVPAPQAEGTQYLIHPLPKHWRHPTVWAPLGTAKLKNELSPDLTLEMGGQDAHHAFTTEHILLSAGTPSQSQQEFYTLAYLHAQPAPSGRIAVNCPRLKETQIIQPGTWKDLWMHGTDILLAGWISRADFRQKATRLPRDSRPIQTASAHAPYRWLPISALHPMSALFEAARRWANR